MDIRPIDAKKAKAVIACELRDIEGFGKYAAGRRAGLLLAKTIVCNPQRTPTLSLNTLRDAIYEDAVAHGLWEEHDCQVAETIAEAIRDGFPYEDPRAVNRSWAMEPIRKEVNELEMSHESEEEYAEELADVIITSMSVAGKLGIDIDAAIRRKMEINKGRSWKHENNKKGD